MQKALIRHACNDGLSDTITRTYTCLLQLLFASIDNARSILYGLASPLS